MDKQSETKAKNIIKRGREIGAVVHVSEAFEMFPVEEEEHKGNIEYWKSEEDEYEV
ncbi:MAG: hypothetical protein FWH14_03890 [Oscillospiraceae bacterium]|nr:hypothetical protein [Oscillospiraceae bacterium]